MIENIYYAVRLTCFFSTQIVKKQGLPWSAAKGYDTFTPIGEFIPKESIPDTNNVDLSLQIDGVTKQSGNTKDMIFK